MKSKLIPEIAPGTLHSSSLLLKPYQQHHNDLFLLFYVLIMFQVDLQHSIQFSKMERFEETLDINDKKDIQITGTKITMPTRP